MNYRAVPDQYGNEYFPAGMPYNYPAHTMPPSQPMNSPYQQFYESPFEYYEQPGQPSEQLYNQPDYMSQQMNPLPMQMQSNTQSNQSETVPFDFNKMLSTVGLLADTAQQVTPFIKQIGAMINTFR